MKDYESTNVYCADCAEYRDEWCEKIIDSPHPDIPRDCKYYKRSDDLSRIVHCKDCESWHTDWNVASTTEYHYCAVMDTTTPPDGFCYQGEKKE